MKVLIVVAVLALAVVGQTAPKQTLDQIAPVSRFCRQHRSLQGSESARTIQRMVHECGVLPPAVKLKPCSKEVCEQGRPPANSCQCGS